LTFFGNRLPSLRKRVQPLKAILSGEPRRNRLGKGLPAKPFSRLDQEIRIDLNGVGVGLPQQELFEEFDIL
jgi:hypothetical protein